MVYEFFDVLTDFRFDINSYTTVNRVSSPKVPSFGEKILVIVFTVFVEN